MAEFDEQYEYLWPEWINTDIIPLNGTGHLSFCDVRNALLYSVRCVRQAFGPLRDAIEAITLPTDGIHSERPDNDYREKRSETFNEFLRALDALAFRLDDATNLPCRDDSVDVVSDRYLHNFDGKTFLNATVFLYLANGQEMKGLYENGTPSMSAIDFIVYICCTSTLESWLTMKTSFDDLYRQFKYYPEEAEPFLKAVTEIDRLHETGILYRIGSESELDLQSDN